MEEKEIEAIVKRFMSIDMEKLVMDTLKEYAGTMVEMQQEQLSSGLASKGDTLQPPYTRRTIELKTKKGQPTDRVTLKDKGAFYRRMRVKFEKNTYELTSRNQKTAALVEKYHGDRGGDVFGLMEENVDRLGRITLPLLQDKFKDKLK